MALKYWSPLLASAEFVAVMHNNYMHSYPVGISTEEWPDIFEKGLQLQVGILNHNSEIFCYSGNKKGSG